MFGTSSLATKFRFDANGLVWPPGYTVRLPAPVGPVTVTFNATAVVPAGRPGTARVNVCPEPSLAFDAPTPMRVSNTRTGVMPVNIGAVGVTGPLAADAGEVPAAFVAVTVNVY